MRLARPAPDAPEGVAAVEVDVVSDGVATRRSDEVTVEEPLEMRVGHGPMDGRSQESIAVTMRTPGDDGALALGFLYGEGIVSAASDVTSVEEAENIVTVELAAGIEFDVDRLSRNVYTTSSCGVCGKASLDAVRVQIPDFAGRDAFTIDHQLVGRLPARLRDGQAAFDRTGGLHASGAFGADGSVVAVSEDVGRHNALDRLLGGFFAEGVLPMSDMGLIFSGRASFELVQKAAMAGCPLIAAIGPPSSLAVELAAEQRITLVGFLRESRFNIYTLPHRVRVGA